MDGSSTHHNFQNQTFSVLMRFAHTASERLLEVVELYSSTACYGYIIIVIPDFAQGLSSACILNERTCEKSSASGVVQAATSAAE